MSHVVVVGPCGTGKSTLVVGLSKAGYTVRAVAQEHSIIRDLWRHGGEPAALVFLEATPQIISRRRGHDFPKWLYHEQLERLKTARGHATLVLDTNTLTPLEVRTAVLSHLKARGIQAHRTLEGGAGNG